MPRGPGMDEIALTRLLLLLSKDAAHHQATRETRCGGSDQVLLAFVNIALLEAGETLANLPDVGETKRRILEGRGTHRVILGCELSVFTSQRRQPILTPLKAARDCHSFLRGYGPTHDPLVHDGNVDVLDRVRCAGGGIAGTHHPRDGYQPSRAKALAKSARSPSAAGSPRVAMGSSSPKRSTR